MVSMDLEALSRAMDSQDIEEAVTAVEETAHICQDLVQMVIDAFGKGRDDCFLIAERLHRFGSLIVDPLMQTYERTSSDEVKSLSAIVLLRMGSNDVIQWLLDRILVDPPDPYLCLIVQSLARRNVKEAGGCIISRLRSYDTSPSVIGRSFESNRAKDTIVCLLHALDVLDVPIPEDLRRRYSALEIPVEIIQLVGRDRSRRPSRHNHRGVKGVSRRASGRGPSGWWRRR